MFLTLYIMVVYWRKTQLKVIVSSSQYLPMSCWSISRKESSTFVPSFEEHSKYSKPSLCAYCASSLVTSSGKSILSRCPTRSWSANLDAMVFHGLSCVSHNSLCKDAGTEKMNTDWMTVEWKILWHDRKVNWKEEEEHY